MDRTNTIETKLETVGDSHHKAEYLLGSITPAHLKEGHILLHVTPGICHGSTNIKPLANGGDTTIAFDGTVYHSEYKSPESEEGDVPARHVKIGVNVNVHISPEKIRHSPLRMDKPDESSETSSDPA